VTFATAASRLNSACLATFGEVVTLRQAAGGESSMSALVWRDSALYDQIGVREATVQCLTADYSESDYRRGDHLVVDGINCSIGTARDDGHGMTLLEIER